MKTQPIPRSNSTSPELIAPCGIDCQLCRAYIREKKPCPGCRSDSPWKSPSCANCILKNCSLRGSDGNTYCYECTEFPCARLLRLNKRYSTKYATNVLENLENIKINGIEAFVAVENKKWACPLCGEMLSMHIPQCPACGFVWHNMHEGPVNMS